MCSSSILGRATDGTFQGQVFTRRRREREMEVGQQGLLAGMGYDGDQLSPVQSFRIPHMKARRHEEAGLKPGGTGSSNPGASRHLRKKGNPRCELCAVA